MKEGSSLLFSLYDILALQFRFLASTRYLLRKWNMILAECADLLFSLYPQTPVISEHSERLPDE